MDNQQDDIAWQGKSWQLRVTNHVASDGTIHETAYIDHPGSVVIVPLRETADGPQVLMINQYRHTMGTAILELPAGTRDWNEELLPCAQRELREETGYRAEKFIFLGHYWPAPGVTNEVMTLYLAKELAPDPLPQDIDEEIVLVPFDLATLLTMAVDGRLQDAKSVVGILRTAYYLRLNPFDD